jgi:predicted PurR-regulated permease PerM
MIALALLVLIAMIAALFGMVDNPEIQQQIQEIIRRSQPAPASP